MPELPEVETIKCGLTPHLKDKTIEDIIMRRTQLRWPIPKNLKALLIGHKILSLSRRGKYLLIHVTTGTLIIHLGMSGSLRIVTPETPHKTHDHVDFVLSSQKLLRFNDPRRFGALLFTKDDPQNHPLIQSMGIEPLDAEFTGAYLEKKAQKRRVPIKSFIMNSKIVTGIGNIYAAEALFLAHIHPLTKAHALTRIQCETLVDSIKKILKLAITAGGTTLKDFVNGEGKPGYFSQNLQVYGRAKLPCTVCNTPLQSLKMGQRMSVYCATCQPLII